MTKRTLLKTVILALTLCAVAILLTIAIIGATENKSYTVTYYSNGNVAKTYTFKDGEKHKVLNTQFATASADKQFFGWYDETGKFYKDIQITVNKNYTLYEAYGLNVKSKDSFTSAIGQAGTYIRLGASIALDGKLTLPNDGLVIIDLNGYNLNITSEDVAFVGRNASIHILNSSTAGNGKITHTGVATNTDLMNASVFRLSPGTRKNVNVHLFKNANIETNVGLFDIVTDLTYSRYTYTFDIESTVSANFLVRTYGINNALFKVYDTAYIKVTGQYAFEDRGSCNGINLTYAMAGGKLDITENTFMTNELSKYNIFLTGGSFNRSLTHLYANYTFALGSDSRYTLTSCKHNDIVVGMTATCTEAGEVTYSCNLCGLTHTEASAAIGHSVVKSLAQEAVTTMEKTEPGYYATVCQRCGHEEREYFYPDPKDVYVTVKLRMDNGSERTIRVKSTDLFGDSVGARLQSFSTAFIEFQYGVKQSNIISIEIPLGVTTIAGGIGNDNTPKGLFYNNKHLEEIILPMSLQNVEAHAFGNIDTLLTIQGIEYITGTIDRYAFKQTSNSKLFIERLEVNAKTIGEQAFYNVTMTSLTFGKNVTNIASKAFGLDEGISTRLLEIFVEGNDHTTYNGVTLSRYNTDFKRFSSLNSGHQFDSLGVVYVDHKFIIETTHPTCQEGGYDFMKCQYCGEEAIGNYTDPIAHNYVTIDPPVQSTCSTQGYEGTKCSMCGDVKVTKYYPYDPSTHDFTYEQKKSLDNICEYDYHLIGVCRCGESDPDTRNWIFMPKTGEHIWDENNPIEYVAPTCGEEGYKTVCCTYCGYEVDIIYKATGKHTMITDNKNTIPATCTNKGTMVWACADCGETKERTVDKDPNNHEWEKDEKGNLVWTVRVAATAEKAGTAQNKCAGCGRIQTKGIPVTAEQTEDKSKLLLIILIAGGSVLVLGGLGITLYYTVFKKNASSGYKYKFNTLGKK